MADAGVLLPTLIIIIVGVISVTWLWKRGR
jgi:hypothetical protein